MPSDDTRLYDNFTAISDLIQHVALAVLDDELKARDEGRHTRVPNVAYLVVIGLTIELLGGEAERDHARRRIVKAVGVASSGVRQHVVEMADRNGTKLI